MRRVDILGVHVHAQRFDQAIATLIGWALERRGRYVCTCPVYTVMLAAERDDVRQAINDADMATADGVPVVWVQKWWGAKDAERVYGPDILLALCEQARDRGVRHFFVGGGAGVAEQLAATVQARFPGVEIAGVIAPQVDDTAIDQALVDTINRTQPHVVWVGLGSPKQDLWMAAHKSHIPALMIGVGAAFDFLSGAKRQAPRWMRRRGLEWLFRLIQEPGRLWKRYLVYNPRFVRAVIRQSRRSARS